MLWGVFTNPPHILRTKKHVIIEWGGEFEIDNKYRLMGEKEGWLVYTGYYREGNEMVYTYRHVP
jgi:hypothetical protein